MNASNDENAIGSKLTREQMLELYKKSKVSQKGQSNPRLKSTSTSTDGIRKALVQTDTNVIQRHQTTGKDKNESAVVKTKVMSAMKTAKPVVTPAPSATRKLVGMASRTASKRIPPTQPLNTTSQEPKKRQNVLQTSHNYVPASEGDQTSSTVSTTSHADSNIDDLLQRLARESAKTVQLDIELESRTSEAASLRNRIEQLQEQLQSFQETSLSQQTKEDQLRQTVLDVQQEHQRVSQQYQEQIQALNIAVSEKDLFIHDLEGVISSLREEISALSARQSGSLGLESGDAWMYQLRIEELEEVIKSAEEEKIQIKQDQAKLEEEVKECYECIDVLEKQEKEYEEQEKVFQVKIENLEAEILSLQTTIFTKQQDFEEQCAEVEKLRNALTETLKENDELYTTVHPSQGPFLEKSEMAVQTDVDLNALILEAQAAFRKLAVAEAKSSVLEQELKELEQMKNHEIAQLSKKLETESQQWQNTQKDLMDMQNILMQKLKELGNENKRLKASQKEVENSH